MPSRRLVPGLGTKMSRIELRQNEGKNAEMCFDRKTRDVDETKSDGQLPLIQKKRDRYKGMNIHDGHGLIGAPISGEGKEEL